MAISTEQAHLINLRQVAEMCDLPESTVYALAAKDELPFPVITFGKQTKRCRLVDVEAFLRGENQNPQ